MDEGYFGPNENQDYQARLELLSGPQGKVMEAFMARKMEERKNWEIVKWEDEHVADGLAKLLV